MSEAAISIRWRSAASTHPGKVRAVNEDAYLCHAKAGIWVVADGVGGGEQGALASRMVTEALSGIEYCSDLMVQVREVERRLQQVHHHLSCERTLARSNTIGTTVVVLVAIPGRAVCLWVGDSRLYMYRRSRLFQLTEDHTLVQQWVREKRITAAEAADHPRANVLTRAIGGEGSLKLERIEFSLHSDDQLLLCSDGLYRDLSVEQMCGVFMADSASRTVRNLMGLALSEQAKDNLTALSVHIL